MWPRNATNFGESSSALSRFQAMEMDGLLFDSQQTIPEDTQGFGKVWKQGNVRLTLRWMFETAVGDST